MTDLVDPTKLQPQDWVLIEHLIDPAVKSIPQACKKAGLTVHQFEKRMQVPIFSQEIRRRLEEYEDLSLIRFETRLSSRRERIKELQRIYDNIPDEYPERFISQTIYVNEAGEEVAPGDEGAYQTRKQILVNKSNAITQREILRAMRDELEPIQHLHKHVLGNVSDEDVEEFEERMKKFQERYGNIEDADIAEPKELNA